MPDSKHRFYDIMLQLLQDEEVINLDGLEIESFTATTGDTDPNEIYFQIQGQVPFTTPEGEMKQPFTICAKACRGWRYTPDSKDCHHLTRVKQHASREQEIAAQKQEQPD